MKIVNLLNHMPDVNEMAPNMNEIDREAAEKAARKIKCRGAAIGAVLFGLAYAHIDLVHNIFHNAPIKIVMAWIVCYVCGEYIYPVAKKFAPWAVLGAVIYYVAPVIIAILKHYFEG